MLPTTVRSEILLKTSLELPTFIISYGVNTAAHGSEICYSGGKVPWYKLVIR